jgi:hypothetical protein
LFTLRLGRGRQHEQDQNQGPGKNCFHTNSPLSSQQAELSSNFGTLFLAHLRIERHVVVFANTLQDQKRR